jgi:preprotein translocase subunit SecD
MCLMALVFAACSGSSAARPNTSSSTRGFVITVRFGSANPKAIETTRAILQNRAVGLGARGTVVDVDAARHLMFVRVPGTHVPSAGFVDLMVYIAELRFRPVMGYLPYDKAQATSNRVTTTCLEGKLVTPRDEDTAANPQVVLADKADKHGKHQLCYVLGPTLLTGRNIGKAAKFLDPNNGWQVDVTFKNDDFVKKVAGPMVNKNVAIVLDGIVQSAPTINPGITGRNVTISGTFSEQEAGDLALALKYGSLPLQDLKFVSTAPAA